MFLLNEKEVTIPACLDLLSIHCTRISRLKYLENFQIQKQADT